MAEVTDPTTKKRLEESWLPAEKYGSLTSLLWWPQLDWWLPTWLEQYMMDGWAKWNTKSDWTKGWAWTDNKANTNDTWWSWKTTFDDFMNTAGAALVGSDLVRAIDDFAKQKWLSDDDKWALASNYIEKRRSVLTPEMVRAKFEQDKWQLWSSKILREWYSKLQDYANISVPDFKDWKKPAQQKWNQTKETKAETKSETKPEWTTETDTKPEWEQPVSDINIEQNMSPQNKELYANWMPTVSELRKQAQLDLQDLENKLWALWLSLNDKSLDEWTKVSIKAKYDELLNKKSDLRNKLSELYIAEDLQNKSAKKQNIQNTFKNR